MARAKHIYQFRLSLDEIRPLVWRRIQVPADCTARLEGRQPYFLSKGTSDHDC